MSLDDKLSQVFDVEPIVIEEKNTNVITRDGEIILSSDNIIETDYEITRSNLYNLLQTGQEALNRALEVAKQSEHPRAFEVVSGLMKDVADVNHKLMDLHKKKLALEAQKGTPPKQDEVPVSNTAIFVGSTSELSKMLDNLRKGN